MAKAVKEREHLLHYTEVHVSLAEERWEHVLTRQGHVQREMLKRCVMAPGLAHR